MTEAGWAQRVANYGDMAGREADVRAAGEPPEFVNRDAPPGREVFYRQVETDRWRTRVVVKYLPTRPGTWAGAVITAHRTTIRRRSPKEKGLWP